MAGRAERGPINARYKAHLEEPVVVDNVSAQSGGVVLPLAVSKVQIPCSGRHCRCGQPANPMGLEALFKAPLYDQLCRLRLGGEGKCLPAAGSRLLLCNGQAGRAGTRATRSSGTSGTGRASIIA